MAFSIDKLQPSNVLYESLAPIIFNDVRSTSEHKSNRKRQCYNCMEQIEKKELYINHQFRYDKRIVTISFHKDCFNNY